MCTVHFDSPHECQKVYAECQNGKTVGGRMLHVELCSNWNAGANEAPSKYTNVDVPRRSSQSASYEESYGFSDNSSYYPNQTASETAQYSHSAAHRSRESNEQSDHSRRQMVSDRYTTGSERHEQSRSAPLRPGARTDTARQGCTLTVSNLPYSATEADIKREFVDAFKVILNLNDQGQSRGVAQVTFSTPEQCNAALYACNQKTLGGRTLRGRIQRDDENGQSGYFSREGGNQRDQSAGRREMSGNQRSYNDSQRGYSNSRGEYGSRGGMGSPRGFGGGRDQSNRGTPSHFRDNNRRGGAPGGPGGGRMNDYNYGRFDRDNRHGGGASGAQGNRHAARDSRDERRDRSPNRNEPVRGYGGGKGPRITSAVIRGNHDRSSSSESSDSDE